MQSSKTKTSVLINEIDLTLFVYLLNWEADKLT